jgi:hypothetical protein
VKPGIQSLWIILTVMVPGLVFYGTFRILIALLGIEISFLEYLDKAGEALSVSVLFSIMFTIQLFGIVTESISFKFGPYKHKNPKYQLAFEKRYEIIATMDPEKDYHIERILGQFFMSHNIAVGMLINFVWTVIYLFVIKWRFDFPAIATESIFLIVTIFSLYVPFNRFNQSCKALHAHIHKID